MNATTTSARVNADPTTSNSSGAMEALFEKLKQAGPAHREKREIRRKAYMTKAGRTGRTASGASVRTVSGASMMDPTSSGGEQPTSPDLPLTPTALPTIEASTTEDDALTSKTQEMLMRLRGENSDAGTGSGAGTAGSLRVRRRRGSGDDSRRERRRRQGSNVSASGTAAATSNILEAGEDPDDAVARAKSALMSMRRGSEDAEDGDENGVVNGGMPTPTTIVSPPSPEPKRSEPVGE